MKNSYSSQIQTWDNSCNVLNSPNSGSFIEVYENDPNITGIDQSSFDNIEIR